MPNNSLTSKKRKSFDALARRCIVHTDRNGKVTSSRGTPWTSALSMSYKEGNLSIKFEATQSLSSGRCWVKVWHKQKLVFSAKGIYALRPVNMVATTYDSGAWEKKIPNLR